MLVNSGSERTRTWSSLVEGDDGCIGPNGKFLCLWQTKFFLQHLHGIIQYTLFDCWANPVVVSFYQELHDQSQTLSNSTALNFWTSCLATILNGNILAKFLLLVSHLLGYAVLPNRGSTIPSNCLSNEQTASVTKLGDF